jgi:hypothetical protein
MPIGLCMGNMQRWSLALSDLIIIAKASVAAHARAYVCSPVHANLAAPGIKRHQSC